MPLAKTTRARWIVRLSLGGLLLILILAVAFAWPRSSRISIEEAKKRYETLEHGNRVVDEAESTEPEKLVPTAVRLTTVVTTNIFPTHMIRLAK